MDKFTAKEILGIDPVTTDYDLKKQYNLYRDLYFPPFFEMTSSRNEQEIKRYMRQRLKSDAIEEFDYYISANHEDLDENAIDQSSISAPPVSVLAFLKFGEVCDAYHELINDKQYPEYPLTMPDTADFDPINKNKTVRVIRKILRGFVSLSFVTLLLIWFFAAFLHQPTLVPILMCVYVAQWICAWLYSPIDMLLVIPRRVWKGIKWGKNRWFVLLLPVLLVCAIICAAWGLIVMLIFPSACVKDRSDKIESSSQLQDHCRDLINSRYDRICRQIEEFKSEYEHRNYQYVCASRRYLEHLDQETIKKKLEYARVTVMETNTFLTNLQEEQIQKINELKDTINDCDRKSANAYKWAEVSAKFAADPDDSVDSVSSDIESDYEAFNKRNVRKKARAHKELKYVEALMKITTHRIRMQAIAIWYEDCIIGGSH